MKTLMYCGMALVIGCMVSRTSLASTKWTPIASFVVKGTVHSAQWTPNNRHILVSTSQGRFATLTMFELATKKKTIWFRSPYGFNPVWGPVGTVFVGPRHAPPALPKALLKKKNRAKLPHKGVFLVSRTIRSFLYPGWKPRFSPEARRMIFQYRGLLYLWNPLPRKRKNSLLLLTKGSDARWAPNGRAVAFTRTPFVVHTKGQASGGGIRIMDMLFRGAKITKTGGEVTWKSNSRAIVYTDVWKPKSVGLFLAKLQGKQPQITPLVRGGRHAVYAPDVKYMKNVVAYTDPQGVWILNTKTRKKKLVAAKAKSPSWSKTGRLVVVQGQRILLFQIPYARLQNMAR